MRDTAGPLFRQPRTVSGINLVAFDSRQNGFDENNKVFVSHSTPHHQLYNRFKIFSKWLEHKPITSPRDATAWDNSHQHLNGHSSIKKQAPNAARRLGHAIGYYAFKGDLAIQATSMSHSGLQTLA